MVLIFCEVKNKQKAATGTRHYVNRLVPKNDIKLLVNVYKTSRTDNIIAWNNKKIIDTLEMYQPSAMYSATAVESATLVCFFEDQQTRDRPRK